MCFVRTCARKLAVVVSDRAATSFSWEPPWTSSPKAASPKKRWKTSCGISYPTRERSIRAVRWRWSTGDSTSSKVRALNATPKTVGWRTDVVEIDISAKRSYVMTLQAYRRRSAVWELTQCTHLYHTVHSIVELCRRVVIVYPIYIYSLNPNTIVQYVGLV